MMPSVHLDVTFVTGRTTVSDAGPRARLGPMTLTSSDTPVHDQAELLSVGLRGDILTMRWMLSADSARVWAALTEPDLLGQWAPYVPEAPLTRVAPFISAADDPAGPVDLSVTDVLEGYRLGMHWGPERLSWQLAPAGSSTQLQLAHTLSNRRLAARMAAGWQIGVERLNASRFHALETSYEQSIVANNADDWDEVAPASTPATAPIAPVTWFRLTGER